MTIEELPSREELDTAFTWKLESLFESETEYRTELLAVRGVVSGLDRYRGRLGVNASTLDEFMNVYWEVQARLGRLRVYAQLPVSVNQLDQRARERSNEFEVLMAEWNAKTSFVAPELLALGRGRVEGFLSEDPGLGYLRRYFERLESNREHVRSADIEELLGRVEEPFEAIDRAYNSLANGELPFEPVRLEDGREIELGRSNYPQLRMSVDRELRRRAFDNFHHGFLMFQNTFADLYLGKVKQSVFSSRARNYASTVDEQLEPREVPRSVLEAVLAAFRKNVGVWHRYWAARRRLLGVDRHQEWDIFAPLSRKPPTVPYSQGVEWIVEGMRPLGEEYVAVMRKGLIEDRWTDVYPNKGKRDGAFAARAYGSQPFIMMSYHDDLESVSTLAHELGHAMHGLYMNGAQPLAYANYAMIVAETASNFNQALVRGHLLTKLTEPDQRLAILDEAFNNFHRYFFIMPTLARFELAVHEAVEQGEGMTADRLNGLMRDLFQEGYGDEMTADERTGVTWAQFGHLYVPFYTFQYAVGIAASAALADDVMSEKEGAAARYLDFLRAGSSVPPVEALKLAGVDMTTAEPIERAFAQLENFVTQLEELAAAESR